MPDRSGAGETAVDYRDRDTMQITPPLKAFFKSAQGVNIAVGYTIDEQIANRLHAP